MKRKWNEKGNVSPEIIIIIVILIAVAYYGLFVLNQEQNDGILTPAEFSAGEFQQGEIVTVCGNRTPTIPYFGHIGDVPVGAEYLILDGVYITAFSLFDERTDGIEIGDKVCIRGAVDIYSSYGNTLNAVEVL